MLIDSNQIISMTEANQNFSKVVRQAEENGCVVIFKNNKPKFVLLDIEARKRRQAGQSREKRNKPRKVALTLKRVEIKTYI